MYLSAHGSTRDKKLTIGEASVSPSREQYSNHAISTTERPTSEMSSIMITPRKSAASRPSVPPPVGDGKRSKARRGVSGHKFVSASAMASLCEEEEELAKL